MDYCMSALRKSRREEAIYNYIADGLFALVNHDTHYGCRLTDLLHPVSEEEQKKQAEDEKKQSAEVVSNLRKKLGGDNV